MEDFRWLLLIFGVLTIVGIYFFSRQTEKSSDKKEKNHKIDPVFENDSIADELSSEFDLGIENNISIDDDLKSNNISNIEVANKKETPQSKIITLRIVARDKTLFLGDELVLSMRGIGLKHGKFGIFHHFDDDENIIFSVASLVEPGSFDMQNIKKQEIPGISLFMVLSESFDCVDAFDMMLDSARALAQTLKGELLDETGSTLSIQRERYLREEIIQFQHNKLTL